MSPPFAMPEAMRRFGVRSERSFRAEQRFAVYAELLAKVSSQGPVAVERAERYRGATGIAIAFDYGITVL